MGERRWRRLGTRTRIAPDSVRSRIMRPPGTAGSRTRTRRPNGSRICHADSWLYHPANRSDPRPCQSFRFRRTNIDRKNAAVASKDSARTPTRNIVSRPISPRPTPSSQSPMPPILAITRADCAQRREFVGENLCVQPGAASPLSKIGISSSAKGSTAVAAARAVDFGAAWGAAGSLIVNDVPLPTVLSTRIRPACTT